MGKIKILMEDTLKKIRGVISEVAKNHGIKIDKIILFGSRARGDHSKDSDWDILVVTGKRLDRWTMETFWEEVMKSLSKINVEVFITTSEELEMYRDVPGTLERYSQVEGKVI